MSELTRQEAVEELSKGRQVHFVSGEFAKFYRDQEAIGIPTPLWFESEPVPEDPQWPPAVLEQAERDNLPPAAPNRVPPYVRPR